MRKVLISGLLIFIYAGFACSVHAVKIAPMPESEIYTYDGEYDPSNFFDWDRLDVRICEKGHHHFLMGSLSEEPKIVELITVESEGGYIVIMYKYFKDGVLYVFAIDRLIMHYVQIQPIEEEE